MISAMDKQRTEAQELTDLLDRLRAMADAAYADYIKQSCAQECLGWQAKVKNGTFGEAELNAHCAAEEKLGRHQALQEAANMLAELREAL